MAHAANKGIASSRACRCYLRLQLAINFIWAGHVLSTFELLFFIFYYYIFIHQRLGADTAMNSLPAAILERLRHLKQHPFQHQEKIREVRIQH